jgi:hypothetical protein
MIKNEKDSSPAHGDRKINTFTMPPPYVQYDGQEEDYDDRNEVEYDLDREDIEWLRLINDTRERLGIPQIEEHTLEQAIDLLEKESHFQVYNLIKSNILNFIFIVCPKWSSTQYSSFN